MPNFGLTKAIGKAVRSASRGAKVVRPGELEADAKEALAKQAEAAKQAAAAAAPTPGVPTAPPASAAQPNPAAATPAPASQGAPSAPQAQAPGLAGPVAAATPTEVPENVAARQAPVPMPKADPNLQVPGQDLADARRLSTANLGNYALDDLSVPNFDKITTSDDIKAVIADTAARNASRIDQARREVITNQQLAGLAGDLDVGEDVIRAVITRENGGVLNPETILGARQVLNSSADRLKNLADLVASGKASDIEKVQFARQVQFHNEYQTQFMGARAEAGRALNAFKIPVGSDATQVARISEIIANSGGDILELARVVKMADTTSGVTAAVKKGLFARAGQASMNLINRVFVNGILSGPPTHVVNIAGNALFQAMNAGELAMAARLGRFLPGAEHVEVGEALASLTGTLNATRDAFRLSAKALKSGETIDNILKYDAVTTGGKTLNVLPELDKPFLGRIVSIIDEVIDAPTRVLGAEDELFKTFAYRADLDRQAFLRIIEQGRAGTIQAQDVAQSTREFLERTPEQSAKAAEDWARQVTFQSPLGPTGQKAQLFLRSVPVLTLIAPFIRTPINIFKQASYRSPMALFAPKFWKDIQAGGRARDIALTRFAIGSATAALVAKWTAEDSITGAGPQSPQAKMIWEASGKRPYSFKRVDSEGNVTWQSYARMEPIASVIGATADATEILAHLNDDVETLTDDEQETYNAAGAIVAGIMNNTGNKTFMKGIADFSDFVSDPKRQVKPYTNQMVSSLEPFSALSRFVRNTQDPYLREAFTILDKVRDNTPGMSKDLPLRLDLFGQPRAKASGSLLGVMSPLPDNPGNTDPVIAELTEVMNQTHLVPITMPGKDTEGMRLNAREFSELVRISRSEPLNNGKTFKDTLSEMIDSSGYQLATPRAKYDAMKHLQNKFDAAGIAELEQQDAAYAERITMWRLKVARLKGKE